MTITPESIKHALSSEQYQLYRLIWSRFVASQMAPARFHDTVADIQCGETAWRAKGERLLFDGYLAVSKAGSSGGVELPKLETGRKLTMKELHKEQKFTQPKPRYSEASLVREMEELGIGRPSTYAGTISTLLERRYCVLEEKHLLPTDLGITVSDKLSAHFKDLMDTDFTARM